MSKRGSVETDSISAPPKKKRKVSKKNEKSESQNKMFKNKRTRQRKRSPSAEFDEFLTISQLRNIVALSEDDDSNIDEYNTHYEILPLTKKGFTKKK